MAEFQKPPPLEIKCTSVDCENDLHCFKQLKRMTPDQRGKCRACGADLVDWKRLHRRDTADAAHTFAALQHELIRHHFFHRRVDERAMRHAQRKGRGDGRQTPFEGNAIYYAQHATATCCRTCLEYWHDIPKGRALTPQEFEYCASLVDLFLDEKLPRLADEPIKVPRRQRALFNEESAQP
jgi:hypothetical protein